MESFCSKDRRLNEGVESLAILEGELERKEDLKKKRSLKIRTGKESMWRVDVWQTPSTMVFQIIKDRC